MRKKRAPKSMSRITALLAAAILLVWGVSMFCLTVVTAQEIGQWLLEAGWDFADYAASCGYLKQFYDENTGRKGWQYTHPNLLEYHMLQAIAYTRGYSVSSVGDFWNRGPKLLRGDLIPLDTAVLFYDKDGNLLHKNSDFIYFQYATEDEWNAGEEETSFHFGWFDLGEATEDDPYARFRAMYAGTRNLYDICALRITGTMESTEIKPVAMDYMTDTLVPVEGAYKLSDLDREGLLDWQPQFDHRGEADPEAEWVTIYALLPQISIYEGDPVTYQGETYDSLLALTEALDFPLLGSIYQYGMDEYNEYGLDRILIFSGHTYRDWDVPDSEPDFFLVTAALGHPLRAAVSELRYVYVVTGLLALCLILFLRSKIKKRLVQPLCEINAGMAENWRYVYAPGKKPKLWREAEVLYANYQAEGDSRRSQKNEITRLNAALDYAKRSEEHRRQMTSGIAHELKTPLAVVHSYAEGLKEHIAEEKRAQYLDVILSETERMDAMVLEMLDLSRLEAGRVKLSRDAFSLRDLVRATFEKLEVPAAEKQLQITLEPGGECPVTADEARIGQVVENFASNALRYTPAGGTILVKTYAKNGKTGCSVENTSRPLTREEQAKVWDTFYRADPSRTGRGTGLGLAIAKQIVELHGGQCAVRNTDTGVEFSFTIPN